MGQFPFLKRPGSQDETMGRRRSTRVEVVLPIILTGRDASGWPFREETETSTVNLHGGRLKTHHQVLVGMQVGIENPRTGAAEKAICVWVEDPAPGQTAHYIAVQLINPGNVWGIETPPPDWGQVAAGLGARAAQPSRPPAGVATPPAAPPIDVDVRFAEFEQRAAEVMESALQIVRRQTEQIVANALEQLRQHLDQTVAMEETAFDQRIEQAFAELEAALKTFREDLEDELAARREKAVAAAEQMLRAKLATTAATLRAPGTNVPASSPGDAAARKK
jgi:hypothetical protein